MSALGEAFRTARESQGLSLSEVADRTHIRSVYLSAMEAGDWSAIGPPVYIRGFVRTYARNLGLDPDAAVAHLDAAAPAAIPVFAPAPRPEPPPSSRTRAAARKPSLSAGAIAGILVAVALMVFVGYQYVDYRRGAAASAVRVAPPANAVSDSARAAGVVPKRAPAPGPVAEPVQRSAFALRLRDSSWLRVTVDGKMTMEGVFAKGTTRSFNGRSATIRAGNAGGVDVLVDGKDLGPMGGLGDVAERSFQL